MQYIFILVSNLSVTIKRGQNMTPCGKILKGKERFLLCNFAESLSDSMPIVVSSPLLSLWMGKKVERHAHKCKISIPTEWLMGWLASVNVVTFPFVWQLSKHSRAAKHCCWAFAVVWHCIPAYLSQLSGGFMGSLGSKQRRITLAPRPLFKRCLALVTNTRIFL